MNINEIVEEKLRGESLSQEEIDFIISSYNSGKLSNNKMYDFMKIINESNFNYEETYYLANAIATTGELLNVSKKVGAVVVDKHSVGTVSDQTSLIFMSVLATLGVKTVKLLSSEFGSFTNSLDRFKVFDGFNARVGNIKFFNILKKVNAGVIENCGGFAPVDNKLYEIRKKTGLVSIPLIAASILAKKIAMGANVAIYDVKAGEGGLLNTEEDADSLAKYLVESSKLAGIASGSVVTNLDQPLGSNLGARVEVEEVLNILRSSRDLHDAKLVDVARELVIIALLITGKADGRSEAAKMFDDAITSGAALEKFREIIKEYGGKYLDFKHSADSLLDGVTLSYITCNCSGYISDIKIKKLIEAFNILYGNKESIDANAGLTILVGEGTKVNTGDKLIRVFYSLGSENFFKTIETIKDSVYISKSKLPAHKVFYKVVI